ncbi:MAG: cohesin domain-containing protein [Eubacteriales bacterium]|nr:cohesin domain-containing protein [Eubacteriales bacterium]
MKKITSILLSLVLMYSLCVTAFASGAALSVSASASQVKQGESVTVTVALSGADNAKSMALTFSYDKDRFTMTSGQWLLSGAVLSDVNTSDGEAAIAYSNETNMNGNVLSFTLQAKTDASVGSTGVSVSPVMKNGTVTISVSGDSTEVSVVCKTHHYGEWSKISDSQHQHTCSACGAVEKANHTWNSGSVTKAASCKETGVKTYTCSACGATKTETMSKTAAHQFGDWKVTKEATCTAAGTQSRTCAVCGKTETKTISALGHSFSKATVTKEPTCTETGVESGKCKRCGETTSQTIPAAGHDYGEWKELAAATCTEEGKESHVCSVCGHEETRAIEALGHDFAEPTVVREATLYCGGLIEGVCSRCKQGTQQIIPCTAVDEATGLVVTTEEGVFPEGSELRVTAIGADHEKYEAIKTALGGASENFTAYDIAAYVGDKAVEPDGAVTVTFAMPEGYGQDTVLYYVAPDGTVEEMVGYAVDSGFAAILPHLGTYVLSASQSDDISGSPAPSSNSNVIVWIIIAVAAAALISVAVILIKRKK